MTFHTVGTIHGVPKSVKDKMTRLAKASGSRPSISQFIEQHPRTYQPVRRHSQRWDRISPLYGQRITKTEARRIVIAATIYDRQTRYEGKRVLGRTAIQILEFFANFAAYSGRVEPSYEYIIENVGCSRDTLTRALKSLRAHGFLDWARRYVPTGNASGPQVKQTTNAYRVSLPAVAERLLDQCKKIVPIAADLVHEARERARMVREYIASLSMRQQLEIDFGDDKTGCAIAASLARIHEMIARKRESEKQGESAIQIF